MKSIDFKVIGRKSWISYIWVLIKYLIVFGLIYSFDFYLATLTDNSALSDYIVYLYGFFVAMFIYKLATLRSFRLYVNDEGVWFSYGILPWTIGGHGIRWKEAEIAYYRPNFLSWITNSYTVLVTHKYTNSSNFVVTNIWRGRKACGEISDIQRYMFGS